LEKTPQQIGPRILHPQGLVEPCHAFKSTPFALTTIILLI
jgi:hypothetical protein